MALASTTNSVAIGSSDLIVTLASTTAITTIGMGLFVDGELLSNTALPLSNGTVAVRRGINSAQVPHVVTSTVYIGTIDQFYLQDPTGRPPTVPLVTPWINVPANRVWTVVSGAWSLGAASGAGTGTGLGVFQTSPTLTTPILGVAAATSVTASGLIKSTSPSAGIGYATGAGGTGTQGTDKSTTVVASPNPSTCGAITMQASGLNAATIVSFTLTNTAIAATDVLVLNHISGGTVGSYTLNAQCGAGSATINVRNNTAGTLSEALVIQYAVIKGVNA